MNQLENRDVRVGMLGLGNIGGAVANKFEEKLRPHGIFLDTVFVRDPSKIRPGVQLPASARLTDDPNDIFLNPGIDIVVELTGAEEIEEVRNYINNAFRTGKHVVTAHKKVLGEYLPDFHDLASTKGLSLSYEASACGTIPIIQRMSDEYDYYGVQTITAIDGILNGTTNSMLGDMATGVEFEPALEKAKEAGVAEPDPTDDIMGYDTRSKLAIFATLASKKHIRPATIPCQGIKELTLEEIAAASINGCVMKLLASAWQDKEGVWHAQVGPARVSKNDPLASVTETLNSVTITSDLSGAVNFTGRGAGPYPTAGAILADTLHAARHVRYSIPDFLPKLQRAEIASVH